MKNIFIVLSMALFLGACTGDVPKSEVKPWKEYTFHIESRPPVITKGMNELLLMGDYKIRGRAYNLVVHFRIGADGRWIQAMQDGHTGVYRRAMKISNPESDELHVRIKEKSEVDKNKDQDQVMFIFPLNYSLKAISQS